MKRNYFFTELHFTQHSPGNVRAPLIFPVDPNPLLTNSFGAFSISLRQMVFSFKSS